MFAVLCVKENSTEICEKMLMSAFLFRFKANYLGKNAWLPQFFFEGSNNPCKRLRFPRGPNLAQNLLHLVSNVLKEGFTHPLWKASLIISWRDVDAVPGIEKQFSEHKALHVCDSLKCRKMGEFLMSVKCSRTPVARCQFTSPTTENQGNSKIM